MLRVCALYVQDPAIEALAGNEQQHNAILLENHPFKVHTGLESQCVVYSVCSFARV